MNIAKLIDHTLLDPTVTIASIKKLCEEADEYEFRAMCIPPLFVKKAKEFLPAKIRKIATVTGFPFGYSAIEAKLAETVLAIVDGADEIDMMINIAALKNADWQYLAKEINTIMPVIKNNGRLIKVIIETGLLSDDEIKACCDLYGAAGVDVIKTSAGFLGPGATIESVQLLRKYLAEAVSINAVGSINSYDIALQLLAAGASTISTGNSVAIVKEAALVK